MTTNDFVKIEDILHLHLPPEKVTQIMREIHSNFSYRMEGSRPGYKGSVVTKPIERGDSIELVNMLHNVRY